MAENKPSKVKIIKFKKELCKECRACEKACSKVHFKTEDGGDKSAIRIIKGEKGLEMTDCNHCGLCIDMCQVLALARNPAGTVLLNKAKCVGCQACVGFCPRGVMRKAPGTITPFKCISCGSCVRACPTKALELAEVDISEVQEAVNARHGRVCK